MKQANPAPNKIRKQSSSGAQSQASRAAFANTRSYYFLSSILVFALLTFLAHRQSPRPDPFQPVQALSWDWWKYPIERNAFKRLPVITSSLNDVFALPNSEKVWAVGDEGMIVHSEDAGETWVQQEVNWEAMKDTVLTHDLPVQEQQQVDSTEVSDARQQNVLNSNFAQKGLNPAPKQANAPKRVPETRPVLIPKSLLTLRSVYFANVYHGWAVGEHGIILATKDGGQTWTIQKSGSLTDLESVHFVNDSLGWVVGRGGEFLATRNGGKTWMEQFSGTSTWFFSVHFVTADTGWAVGYGGVVCATKDGGQSWTKQRIDISPDLESVFFINPNTGWIVGSDGTILATSNGGQTWSKQWRGTSTFLSSVNFVNAEMGWAVGSDGTILMTNNSGATWQEQRCGTRNELRSVHFVNATTGWAVGMETILVTKNGGVTWQPQTRSLLISTTFADSLIGWAIGSSGTILLTRDGGAVWQPQTTTKKSFLYALDFVDNKNGWIVGNSGTILATRDGGTTWQSQVSGITSELISVHFVNNLNGWVVSEDGGILMTRDGGTTWEPQASRIRSNLVSVNFADSLNGWAVGWEGKILKTQNGGAVWKPREQGLSVDLSSVYFVDASNGWILGEKGTILVTKNGGETWNPQPNKVTNDLSSVHFVDISNGWSVGDKGTILVTKNGGVTWESQKSGSTDPLYSVYFTDILHGWVMAVPKRILSTTDGGQTWRDPTLPYSRSFAPWYYLSLLLLTPLLYLAFRKPKPIEAEQKTVADMLVSDRPIAAGEPDPLEFNAIARGLSRFLRNENTQPPLTIAITGEWGSGKSSLMNLLKADLARYRFRPVWFNAWHHQKEEHLLAALLQNIRKQALPRWWRPEGMSFRARLFWARVRRYRVLALVLLAGFSVAVGYFTADHPTRLHEAVQQIEHFFTGDATLENTILGWLQHKLSALGKTSVLALLSSLGAAMLVLWRGLRAFGVNPANLMASLSNNFKLSEAKAQMGFRHDFAREFSEVTAALNPRTMLILIDDLDRCRPENVLEVLEAVNFLVSSGDCYVVMGLDLTRVERCVGLGFKGIAEELADEVAQEPNKDGGKSQREKFARQYLEKLINIEVPVPKPQPAQSQSLIVPPESVAREPVTWWQNLLQMSAPKVRAISPWVLAAAVLVAGFWFGIKQFSPQAETPSATTIAQTTQPTPSINQPTPSTTTAQPTQRNAPADSSRGTGELIQPEKEPASFAFVYVALALMLGLGMWRLSIPTDLVVKDSPEFIDALKIWHPVLIAKRNTPRSVKRFVNRVRYFAMRQSSETEAQSVWQKLAVWAGLKKKEEVRKIEAVAESILVALSAIQQYDSKLRSILAQWKEPVLLDTSHESGVLFQTLTDHINRFDNWPPSEEDRERLEKLSAGIRIN